jgi:hypothetical protein
MNSMAGNYMKAAVIYAIGGMGLGVAMGASHDFSLSSVHSHLSLLGWMTMAIYGLYYQLVPAAAERRVANIQFWLANAGVVILCSSVGLIVHGKAVAEAGAVVGSLALLTSMLIFAGQLFAGTQTAGEKVIFP